MSTIPTNLDNRNEDEEPEKTTTTTEQTPTLTNTEPTSTLIEQPSTPTPATPKLKTQTHSTASQSVTISRAFSKYDTDNSNTIDASELEQLCAQLGSPFLNDKAVRVALSHLDSDKSGTIDKDEFVKWWTGENENAENDTALAHLREQGLKDNHVDVHTASWSGDLQTIKRLVALDRALVNAPDTTEFGNDNRPLHYASYQGHIDSVRYLLDNGANSNARNTEGCTPIFLASQQGRIEVLRVLMRSGAVRLEIADKKHSFCPLDVAQTDECREFLEDFYELSPPPKMSLIPMLTRDKIGVLTVSWNYTPQESAGTQARLPIKCFRAQLLDESELANVIEERVCGGESTSVTVAGVRSARALVARVSLSNSQGESDWSEVSESVCAVETPEAPGKPSVAVVGRTSLQVTWTPVIDNGSTIKYIEVQLATVPEDEERNGASANSSSSFSSLEWKTIGRFPESSKSATLCGLAVATEYRARLTATNSRGTSRFSGVSEIVKTRGVPVKTKRAVKKMKAVMAFQLAGKRKEGGSGGGGMFGSAA